MLKITGNIISVIRTDTTENWPSDDSNANLTGYSTQITITGSDLVATNPEWDGCAAEKIVASPVTIPPKLHFNDLRDGLVVQMAHGEKATVCSTIHGVAFDVAGPAYIMPEFDAKGYVLNATRVSSASKPTVDGAIIAGKIAAAAIGAEEIAADAILTKPWPRDPRADDLKASDIQQGRVPAGWVNSAPAVNVWSTDEWLAHQGLLAMQRLAHKTATEAGWYVDPATGKQIERNFGEVVALMHSELSEALEADRTSAMDDKLPHRPGTEVEFADCLIRIFDTAAARGLDVAGAAIEKNRFNRDRADHKLANRNAEGGKKY